MSATLQQNFKRELFGTDGIRGVAGEYPLDRATVYAIGRALGQRLRGASFVKVFASPSQRARRTAELAGSGNLAEIDPDLAEWDYGQYEGRRGDFNCPPMRKAPCGAFLRGGY